jgi:hypothetical protein
MSAAPPHDAAGDGALLANIMHFARALRAAGLALGPERVIDAVRAVEVVGIRRRDDFYWALHAVLVNRRDQRELFDQAFHIFWRNPRMLENMQALTLPRLDGARGDGGAAPARRRVVEAILGGPRPAGGRGGERDDREAEPDAALTYSPREVLRSRDFEDMSADEIRQAKQAIAAMRLPLALTPTRRFAPDARGARVDMRATLRAALRSGAAIIPLRRRRARLRPPPLVVLCDISGSMSRYSRMFLHFLHAISHDRERVCAFLFGTRLSNVTRYLRDRDADTALAKLGEAVDDWDGGTRIGHCLKEFNLRWSRRVLGQGALVLFISDGLDRDAGRGLEREIERLHKSCRRLIWLNPLLRYQGFEPKSAGIRAILPHVDDFRPVHNLDSLSSLAGVLTRPGVRKEEGATQWRQAS